MGISGEQALGRVGAVLHHYQHNDELIDVVRSLPAKGGSSGEKEAMVREVDEDDEDDVECGDAFGGG